MPHSSLNLSHVIQRELDIITTNAPPAYQKSGVQLIVFIWRQCQMWVLLFTLMELWRIQLPADFCSHRDGWQRLTKSKSYMETFNVQRHLTQLIIKPSKSESPNCITQSMLYVYTSTLTNTTKLIIYNSNVNVLTPSKVWCYACMSLHNIWTLPGHLFLAYLG